MPIYEYACAECGHQFETLVRSGTQPQCPNCQSKALEKRLSVFATTNTTAKAMPAMPAGCASCEHRGGDGACGMG